MRVFAIYKNGKIVRDGDGLLAIFTNETGAEKHVIELKRWNIQRTTVNYETKEIEMEMKEHEKCESVWS